MDISIDLLMAAAARGAASGAGGTAWRGLCQLWPPRTRRQGQSGPPEAADDADWGVLAALEEAPADPRRAADLLAALDKRAAADPQLEEALYAWSVQANYELAEPFSKANGKTSGDIHINARHVTIHQGWYTAPPEHDPR